MSTTTDRRFDLSPAPEPCVRPDGIRFENIAPERVRIEIDVENPSEARTERTALHVEAAPLGAFVRWRPLATIPLPALPPWGATTVQTIVRQPRPQPQASLRGLVPSGLLAPPGGEDRRARPNPMLASTLTALFRGMNPSELPPDLLDLLDGPRPHWAGNLNVWIGKHPVERHMAPRLRVHAGITNLAMFCVGHGGRDAYGFRVGLPGEDWRCVLYDLLWGVSVPFGVQTWQEQSWHEVGVTSLILLALRPPDGRERGVAEVHVAQRSSGRTALVEFDLDPDAEGPGCFRLA